MSSKVYVLIWFDTEDYILPAADDATLRLARFLSGEGIQATFKMVGEKVRVLAKRRRRDVIRALKKHEIGYHTDFHSVHPTPAEYLSNLGWDEGVAEFDRRERRGFEDVGNVLGARPTCYGQPGSSWGPQAYGAMREWGVDIYLDAGRHVTLDGKPCFYLGAFNLLQLTHTIRAELGGPADLEQAKNRFKAARQKLLREGGGVVSVYYHPCEFLHRQFWDGVNFARGENPPREEWKEPPVKSAAAAERAFANFEAFVRYMALFPEVAFLTAADARDLYADKSRGFKFSRGELAGIAKAVKPAVDFQEGEGFWLAPSEILSLLNRAVSRELNGTRAAGGVTLRETPLGPTGASPVMREEIAVPRSQFVRTVADVQDHLERRGRVPSAVWLGSTRVSPESYLVSLARVASGLLTGGKVPESVRFAPAELAPAARIAEDSPGLWGWVIFTRGFKAPAMMELAKRQAWTLKPANLERSA